MWINGIAHLSLLEEHPLRVRKTVWLRKWREQTRQRSTHAPSRLNLFPSNFFVLRNRSLFNSEGRGAEGVGDFSCVTRKFTWSPQRSLRIIPILSYLQSIFYSPLYTLLVTTEPHSLPPWKPRDPTKSSYPFPGDKQWLVYTSLMEGRNLFFQKKSLPNFGNALHCKLSAASPFHEFYFTVKNLWTEAVDVIQFKNEVAKVFWVKWKCSITII